VRRFVFIALIIGLLVAAETLALWSTNAVASYGALKVQSLGFFYKADEQTRFLDLKTRWQAEHLGEISHRKASELADEAYGKSDVESPFTLWRYHGGPSPNIFSGKVHLFNTGKEALLNVPMAVTLRARVGDLRVKPAIQTTDYDYLESSSRWVTLGRNTVTVQALAPGEDMLLEVGRFRLMDFLAENPNRWPVEVEVQVTSPQTGTVKKSIALIPDHFVVPNLY
jgi:hypothetical protein